MKYDSRIDGYCHILKERSSFIVKQKLVLFTIYSTVSMIFIRYFNEHFLGVNLKCFFFRVCPDELDEATSSLIYAASKCGKFPELQKIRSILTSWFGNEFAVHAIELSNKTGSNCKVITIFSFAH